MQNMAGIKIFLAGGGSGGATAPVLAVAEAVVGLQPGAKLFLVGNRGVEEKMIVGSPLRLQYLTIPAGKWRRYFSFANFVDPFKIAVGFIKSLYLIRKYRPDIIFGAGSFVQVPLVWAGYLLRVPGVVHQPDMDLLLSTRLVAPVARVITASFAWSGKNLPGFSGLFKKIEKSKIQVTGNPVRREIFGGSRQRAQKVFHLNSDYPVMLVMGGSQGAAKLNASILAAAPELVKYLQIIHLKGSKGSQAVKGEFEHPHYHAYDYLDTDLKDAYAVADFVICRAGISTITELSALQKPAVVVPLPKSPQETNAQILAYTRSAVVVFEEFLNAELVVRLARKMLWQNDAVKIMQDNIRRLLPGNADKKIAKIIFEVYGKS